MVKVYEVGKEEFLHKFLDLFSVIQSDSNKFTKQQKQLLVEYIMLPDPRYTFSRFMMPGRKAVTQIAKDKYGMEISSTRMTQFITEMCKRGVIVKDQDGVKYLNKPIKSYLDSAFKSEEPIEIKFKFKINGDTGQDRDSGKEIQQAGKDAGVVGS